MNEETETTLEDEIDILLQIMALDMDVPLKYREAIVTIFDKQLTT